MKFTLLLASVSAIKVTGGPDYGEIPAYMVGSDALGSYDRTMPKRFTQERDDRLMNSLVKNYAREISIDGKPTGQMFLNHDDAVAVSNEVLKTHKPNVAQAEDGPDFEDTWNHFDVNHDGLVEVERMPQFLRYLTNGALDIDMQ